jgi:glyoxylase-like metal-dependent hydrolase (beta-lactamase superfamily II)
MKGNTMDTLDHMHVIPLGDVKAFIIEGEKTILVDTGIKPVHPDVMAFFDKMGIKFQGEKELEFLKKGSYQFIMDFIQEKGFTIDTIICTHYHNDHVGSLKQLKESLNAPVAMHPLDIPFVEGKEEPPPSAVMPPDLAKHFKSDPCPVEITLEDKQMFTSDIQIIHLEGHTKGNICLLFKEEVLLAGDSLMGKNETNPLLGANEINPPMPNASMDQEMAMKNLQKLLDYNFDVILPSHGDPIKENAKDKLRKFIEAN